MHKGQIIHFNHFAEMRWSERMFFGICILNYVVCLRNRFWLVNAMHLNDKSDENLFSFCHVLASKNEKWVLDYFITHQSKMAHAFIVNFITILAFFVYAGKSEENILSMVLKKNNWLIYFHGLYEKYIIIHLYFITVGWNLSRDFGFFLATKLSN